MVKIIKKRTEPEPLMKPRDNNPAHELYLAQAAHNLEKQVEQGKHLSGLRIIFKPKLSSDKK